MIIPALVLISSFLFLFGVFNFNFPKSTKKLLVQLGKPFSSPPVSPLFQDSPSISTPKNPMKRADGLKELFDTFDKNGDGFITRQELQESLRNIGIFVPPKEVQEMVENLDSNRDGLIDLGEFKGLFELLKKGEKEEGKGVEYEDEDEDEDEDEEGDLKEAFDVFDGDRDGLITVEELGLVLSSMGLIKEGSKREEDCREMIRKVDVDGDGMVNFDEFKRMMRGGFCGSSLVHAF